MNISANYLCSYGNATNLRGDEYFQYFVKMQAKKFSGFCILALIINIAAITVSLCYKALRKHSSVRLFILVFCGNICTILSILLTTILKLQEQLTCNILKGSYIIYRYGMASSSYACLTLIYINFSLAKREVLLTAQEMKNLNKKVVVWYVVVTCCNILFLVLPIIFMKHSLAFAPIILSQFTGDAISIFYCVKLSVTYWRLLVQTVNAASPVFLQQAKDSRKLILPSVVLTSIFKFTAFLINLITIKVDKKVFIFLAHLYAIIYFSVFIIVPCFYLHTKRKVRRTRAKLQLEKFTTNDTSDTAKQKEKVTTTTEQSLDKEIT